jgi:Tfp pilus assembly protein PilE
MSLSMKRRSRRGQGLVEYIIIVAAVALISLVAVSVFGHKVADQYAIGAGMLPGAHAEDNLAIVTGEYAGFAENAAGDALIATGGVTWADITGNTTSGEMDNNPVTNADATTGLPDNSADSFVGE